MATLTDLEQYMLELINRARADPAAEAARFGIDLNEGLDPGTITADAKAPLAPNALLTDAARGHSAWMLDADMFSHTGSGGSTPTERIAAAGYTLGTDGWATGENISWTGTTAPTIDLEAAIVSQHEGLFRSSGHRVNILEGSFRELGIGQQEGVFTSDGTDFQASMVTQNFAFSGSTLFLTGVVYDDQDSDAFYSPGEGLGSVQITVNGSEVGTTAQAGGYSLALGPGDYTIGFSGGDLDEAHVHTVTIADRSVKLDILDTNSDPAVPDGTNPVYRFYNTIAGGHFFTVSSDERDSIRTNLTHFNYEGVGFAAKSTDDDTVAPVYRFYNTEAGGHFFTMATDERDTIINNLPHFTYEGVGFYADGDGTIPIYRFYNTESGGHFFTPSVDERDSVIANLAHFTYEGVGLYAWDVL